MTNLRDVTYIFISSTSDIDVLQENCQNVGTLLTFCTSGTGHIEGAMNGEATQVMINKAITRNTSRPQGLIYIIAKIINNPGNAQFTEQ